MCYSQLPINAYYINLEQSVERKKKINKLDFFFPLERFNACLDDEGAAGCAKSHLNLLKKIYESDKSTEYTIIIEDDFTILDKGKYKIFLIRLFDLLCEKKPDVVMMTGTRKVINKSIYYNGFFKLFKCNTTAGYIIRKSYIPELIKSFEASYSMLKFSNNFVLGDGDKTYQKSMFMVLFPIDQLWTYLQQKDRWFIYYDSTFMMQEDGYSIIGKNATESNLKELHLTSYLLEEQYLLNYNNFKWRRVLLTFDWNYWEEDVFRQLHQKGKNIKDLHSIYTVNETGIIKI